MSVFNKIRFLITFVAIGFVIYSFGFRFFSNYALDNYPLKTTKAIVINEINSRGKGSHISNNYTYSFLFFIGGKEYKGNTYDKKYRPGDTVLVKYWPNWPKVNNIIKK